MLALYPLGMLCIKYNTKSEVMSLKPSKTGILAIL